MPKPMENHRISTPTQGRRDQASGRDTETSRLKELLDRIVGSPRSARFLEIQEAADRYASRRYRSYREDGTDILKTGFEDWSNMDLYELRALYGPPGTPPGYTTDRDGRP